MLNITLSPEAAARFKELLAEEDNEDAVFRIREVKVGMACKSHMELRMGIDEREDEDEEQEVTVEGMPFVINNDVIDIYGSDYDVVLDENGLPNITAKK
ncbi:ErpA-related iron-sulfur cluster insertion protein [Mailhella sp.]|uniref:ErpA-related iron-sulfur cluster insertion protein n=1 Tax=Mailhella sp. TaxID=1981029 RepID=UPI004062CC00